MFDDIVNKKSGPERHSLIMKIVCPKCGCDDILLIKDRAYGKPAADGKVYDVSTLVFCSNCDREFIVFVSTTPLENKEEKK